MKRQTTRREKSLTTEVEGLTVKDETQVQQRWRNFTRRIFCILHSRYRLISYRCILVLIIWTHFIWHITHPIEINLKKKRKRKSINLKVYINLYTSLEHASYARDTSLFILEHKIIYFLKLPNIHRKAKRKM